MHSLVRVLVPPSPHVIVQSDHGFQSPHFPSTKRVTKVLDKDFSMAEIVYRVEVCSRWILPYFLINPITGFPTVYGVAICPWVYLPYLPYTPNVQSILRPWLYWQIGNFHNVVYCSDNFIKSRLSRQNWTNIRTIKIKAYATQDICIMYLLQ